MSARNIILYAAAAILLAVSASSCDPGKEGPVATARIETAASTSLGSAKTSLFLSVTAEGDWSIELRLSRRQRRLGLRRAGFRYGQQEQRRPDRPGKHG